MDGSAGKEFACNAGETGDVGSLPGSGRSPEEGHGNQLFYSCLENPMNRGVWQATVQRISKSWTQLSTQAQQKGLRMSRTSPTFAAAAAKSLQSCPTLCDPIDGSPPGAPVPGILQARTLEWVAISFNA